MVDQNDATDEFQLIADFFAPLAAQTPGACGLLDDAAWLRGRAGHDLVLTTDALVAGTHFLPDDPPDLVARKLIGVNLSDLAAKGARSVGYLLTLVLPRVDREWLGAFTAGLRADQDEYGIALFGGDTVATPGPLTLSATAFGWVESGHMIRRSGARAGDRVYVSGTLGDAALGLAVLKGAVSVPAPDADFLVGRYRRPRPRSELGPRLVGLAHAAADISDGLVADLGHICTASGVGAVLQAARIPLSAPALRFAAAGTDVLSAALSGGDDYELIFTAPPDQAARLFALADELAIPIAWVGDIVADADSVRVVDATGAPIALDRRGWTHFADKG